MNYNIVYSDSLYHHGILGQKWGVRRYQNYDGTLTAEGKSRIQQESAYKIHRDFTKQIKRERKNQYDFSNRFGWTATIGENSKAALDKFRATKSEIDNSPELKVWNNRFNTINNKIEKAAEKGDYLKVESLEKESESLLEEFKQTDIGIRYMSHLAYKTYGDRGLQYAKEYVNGPGKEITLGYLKDLGYNEEAARFIEEKLTKNDLALGF